VRLEQATAASQGVQMKLLALETDYSAAASLLNKAQVILSSTRRMCVCVCFCLSLSLSLCIYIYVYIYIDTHRRASSSTRRSS